MEDKAAQAVRSKRDSSMRVGLKMVREGRAGGFVTAGNTGAAMATAKMVLGSLAGVDRPALATVLPTTLGTPCVFLDVGANVDCDARNLLQFAVMGHMYAKNVLRVDNPRVGLLSIGEEESKGNALTREALPLLRELGLNFIGNVEGRDLYNGHADVVVTDGFVGNVALKTSEGIIKLVTTTLRESLKSTVTAQVGALLSRKAFTTFKKRFDYSEYGGAPLLGVRGVLHRRPRLLERARYHERHSRGRRVRRQRGQSRHRGHARRPRWSLRQFTFSNKVSSRPEAEP